jgi:splicing factor 3B subunit 3
VRKWSDAVDNGANLLIPVPGGGDGPGGVLVAAENFLLYRHQVGWGCGGWWVGGWGWG